MVTFESVVQDALLLSDEDRAWLIRRLEVSHGLSSELDADWRDEVERRLERPPVGGRRNDDYTEERPQLRSQAV